MLFRGIYLLHRDGACLLLNRAQSVLQRYSFLSSISWHYLPNSFLSPEYVQYPNEHSDRRKYVPFKQHQTCRSLQKLKGFRNVSESGARSCSSCFSGALLSRTVGDSKWTWLRSLAQYRNHSTVPKSVLLPRGSENSPPSSVEVDLDLERRLSPESVVHLRQNLSARGSDIDLDILLAAYNSWREVDSVKTKLENERTWIAKSMASLVKSKGEENQRKKEELTERGKAIKNQLKEIMPSWFDGKHKVMELALQLPADLHSLTPLAEDIVETVTECKTQAPDGGNVCHVEFAERRGLLKFSNVGPRAVYLLGKLAELEQTLLHQVASKLTDQEYIPLAAPEIFRSLVVEGCGIYPAGTYADRILSLSQKMEKGETEVNRYHLTGNSLLSYAAFLTKRQVRKDQLPVKMYCIGRHYQPAQDLPGLYGTVQSNRVTMFGVGQSLEQVREVHQDMETVMEDIGQQLGLPVRTVKISAKNLAPSESLRTELQVWAPGVQQYVQMAHVSIHDDYASRRLMSRSSGLPHLHMVFGVALDTGVVLASLMEHGLV